MRARIRRALSNNDSAKPAEDLFLQIFSLVTGVTTCLLIVLSIHKPLIGIPSLIGLWLIWLILEAWLRGKP